MTWHQTLTSYDERQPLPDRPLCRTCGVSLAGLPLWVDDDFCKQGCATVWYRQQADLEGEC